VICKREVKAGARRSIQWHVERATASAEVQQQNASSARTEEPATTPQPTTPAPAKPPAKPPVNGDGPQPPAPAPTVLERCLIDALHAAMGAERWAKEHDCGVRFTSEDVRALGISLYIQRERAQPGGRS
jgi:hypothetical protein